MKVKHRYLVTSTPHVKDRATITDIMLDVLIALTPAAVMSVYYFGSEALTLIFACIASCVFFEAAYQKFMNKPVTIKDLSAAVTGLLLAMNLPASAPVWVALAGGFFAIIIVKQLFGGLGQNFLNPALAARAFLVVAYPKEMTDWSISPDAISSATPLTVVNSGGDFPNLFNMFIGKTGGSLGETCAALLILGGLYLLAKRIISWRIPVVYIGTVFVLTWIFGRGMADGAGMQALFMGQPFHEIFSGALMLGAIYMATDYSSSPQTPLGQIIFAFGCGLLTSVIRVFGAYAEGVCFSILLMNLAVPLLDKYIKPKIYGSPKKAKIVKKGAEGNA
jgi:electron transport complex protein RnfD